MENRRMPNGTTRENSAMDNEGFEMNEPNGIMQSPPDFNANKKKNGSMFAGTDSLPRIRKNVSTINVPESKEQKEIEFEDLDYDSNSANILARIIEGARFTIYNLVVKNKNFVKIGFLLLIFLLCNAYFATAIAYNRRHNLEWDWCDGHGLLIILFAIIYWSLFYYYILKRFFGKAIYNAILKPIGELGNKIFSTWVARLIGVLVVIAGIVAFIVVDAWNSPKRLISAIGVIVMVVLGVLFSRFPGRIQWRQVLGGMAAQFVLGMLVLRWEGGQTFLNCLSDKVSRFLNFADDGSSFIYSYLSSGKISMANGTLPEELVGKTIITNTLFAFQALSVIYFFGFVVGLLYHIGVMSWVVGKVGWLLQVIMRTTAAESMNASANIFLGQTEAPLLIKPYLNDMTKSEIHAVMTGGFATIAGSVMAAYISFGVSASSLLTASVMAAPAALAFSKILWPETQVSKTSAKDIKSVNTKSEGNALDAAAQGAAQGFILIGNIIANIIAVVSFVAFLNAVIGWIGFLVGQDQMSFEWLLGKIFIPIAYCLGVDDDDVEEIALLLGLKTVVNEFVAYQRLLSIKNTLTKRSIRIAEYALCSFANFSSVGIQLGGLSTLAPLRRHDLSNVVWSSLLAGTITSLYNACVAGALLPDEL